MVVYGQDERVVSWIADQLGYPESFPCSSAIGYERDGHIVAGVCFDNMSTTNLFAHIATSGPLPRALLVATALYAFKQCGVLRMTFMVYDDNAQCVRLVEDLGAELEAKLKDGHAGGDTLIYALRPCSRFYQRLLESGRIAKESTQ